MKTKVIHRKQMRADNSNDLFENIHRLMAVDNCKTGLIIKVGLLTGLGKEELLYVFKQKICDISGSCCDCHKIHAYNKGNGITVVLVKWIQNNDKCYFAILPTVLWERFRQIPALRAHDIKAADKIAQEVAGFKFSFLHKIYHKIIFGTMDADHLDILTDSVKTTAARHCLLFGLDKMIYLYCRAWERASIVLPVI